MNENQLVENEICPCGSSKDYSQCCERYLTGKENPSTAEALMRSRYTAFTKGEIGYIKTTLAPESRGDFDEAAVRQWSTKSEWLGLEIIRTENGGPSDSKGVVEFNAKYRLKGKVIGHHEVSTFRKEKLDGKWYFVDGDSHEHQDGEGHHHHREPMAPVVRTEPKIGRNDPCHCGSGQKYKKCHGT